MDVGDDDDGEENTAVEKLLPIGERSGDVPVIRSHYNACVEGLLCTTKRSIFYDK